MTMNALNKILLASATVFLAFSCAEEKDESSESVQNRILQAYIETHYPGTRPTASGLYIVDSIPGTGRTLTEESYALVDYTITYLDSTYIDYTEESIARQLGEYTPSGYYHPRILDVSESNAGIKEILTGMKEGGMVKAVIPATLLSGESGSELVHSDGSSRIYKFWLREVIDDAYSYQIEQLEEFSARSYNLDSTEYGFYFTKTKFALDSIESGDEADIRYIGKYLDGTVFDTNIEDSAKKYDIYSSSNTYEALTFKYKENEDETLEDNSFVQGFTKALWRMGYGDRAVTFFYSSLGYGDDGNDNIPGFVPLFFELWVEEEED